MGRRIDAVLIIEGVVFALEFKVGEEQFEAGARDQVWDYALDLKNFHEASHHAPIVPILIATGASNRGELTLLVDEDGVYRPLSISPGELRHTVQVAIQTIRGTRLDPGEWARARYRPTPTIVEAARALYAQHSVEDIARHDAGAENLTVTSSRIEELIDESRANGWKTICFLTGVPGAGKTLVGLNVATRRRDESEPTHAVFLSGNGPLVAVLREALTRDEHARRLASGIKSRKGKVGESVKAFIQNVHHFRDDALFDDVSPPVEHVAIFDEAQRAWTHRQTALFMARKKGRPGFAHSEPEFLISYLNRHHDWAVVVCLVGGGQEINTGEAGIEAWLEALRDHYPDWRVCLSSRISDSEYASGRALDILGKRQHVTLDDSLHLAVSMRSFRAEKVSAFVKALLDCDKPGAQSLFEGLSSRFPICVTRDLGRAKSWVRSRARGSERFGLLASSRAQRLKPHAVDVRVNTDPVHWFLNDRSDTRSSYYLEDAATEFQVQGLEVDWSVVTWDGDMRFGRGDWMFHDFRGSNWTKIHKQDTRRYVLNAYRVLLTRARQGMVIFVPPGDSTDPTRAPEFYDGTYDYLRSLGLPEVPSSPPAP